ncbi:speriolin-like protein [Clupea harengus]|uniref:Speriolin-like protein n=1 Tax=Clupea harengus TaxID=7950 RepID=A0A6P8G9X8_CLUHA|nr:speriolin-like protein [Clupea harengus]
MDPEESHESLRLQNDKLRQENDDLKLMLGLMKENQSLRSKLFGTDVSIDHGPLEVKSSGVTWDDTLDEGTFTSELLKGPLRTSSPLEITAARKSVLKSARLDEDQQDRYVQHVKDPERLVGEIAFQLDRRILAHVFQTQHRLYGFTVLNIRHKIRQVCTHPVTGEVDEGLLAQVTDRWVEVMERLGRIGYNAQVHPSFTELIVNTYGILRQRPDPHRARRDGYGSPEDLRRLVVNTVPARLLKGVLLLHTCLCYLAHQDGKPLFLW